MFKKADLSNGQTFLILLKSSQHNQDAISPQINL